MKRSAAASNVDDETPAGIHGEFRSAVVQVEEQNKCRTVFLFFQMPSEGSASRGELAVTEGETPSLSMMSPPCCPFWKGFVFGDD